MEVTEQQGRSRQAGLSCLLLFRGQLCRAQDRLWLPELPGCPSGLCQRARCLPFDSNEDDGWFCALWLMGMGRFRNRPAPPALHPSARSWCFPSRRWQSLVEGDPDRHRVLSLNLRVITGFFFPLGDPGGYHGSQETGRRSLRGRPAFRGPANSHTCCSRSFLGMAHPTHSATGLLSCSATHRQRYVLWTRSLTSSSFSK